MPTVLSSPNPVTDGEFGRSVALTPTITVVGASNEEFSGHAVAGRAYVTDDATNAVTALASPNPATLGGFGSSVAASGNLVVVGAPDEPHNGVGGAGMVYLFNATGRLLASYSSPNLQANGYFGWSVGISGSYLIVGAPFETRYGYANSGETYLINFETGATRLLLDPNPAAGTDFGFSVAISGTRAVVGAMSENGGGVTSAGAAYVYSVPTGNVVATLVSPEPTFIGEFGYAVAINGTFAVVGAPGEPNDFNPNGSAYGFNLATHAVTLYSSSSPTGNGDFGGSVSTDGVTVLIGAHGETSENHSSAGRAYLFGESSGSLVSSTFWAPGSPGSGNFGNSVANLGSSVLIGAPFTNASGNTSAGQAYLFNEIPLTVSSPAATSGGQFGRAVGISDGITIIGAPQETAGGQLDAGNAYLVNIDPSPRLAVLKLSSPTPSSTGLFGFSVAIDGTTAVVGAWGESSGGDASAGNAYIFNSQTGQLVHALTTPNPTIGGNFGYSVATNGSAVVVGAPTETGSGVAEAGNAYLFNTTTGALEATLTSPNPVVGGRFGESVAFNGGTLLVGAPEETGSGVATSGHAYLIASSSRAVVVTLASPNAQSGGGFGISVALGGGLAVVGAPLETAAGYTDGGRAYVFSAATGSLTFSLESTYPQLGGYFGQAVATNGGTVVVGAYGENTLGLSNAGGLYLFDGGSGGVLDRFYSPNFQGSGFFGYSIAEGPARIVAGAYTESSAGSAYVFCLAATPL